MNAWVGDGVVGDFERMDMILYITALDGMGCAILRFGYVLDGSFIIQNYILMPSLTLAFTLKISAV